MADNKLQRLERLGEMIRNYRKQTAYAFYDLSKECPHRNDMKIGHGSHHEYVLCEHNDKLKTSFIEFCAIGHCPFVEGEEQ